MEIFFKIKLKDTTKQYILHSIIRCLVELKYIGKKWLIFLNENIITHQLIYNIVMTNLLSILVTEGNSFKIVLLLLIIL